MKRITVNAVMMILFTVSSRAEIVLWAGASNDVTINDVQGSVTILAAGTFKLQSVTAGNLDDIDLIEVADGVTGTVNVYVLRNPADSAGTVGAVNVGEINLTNDQGALLTGNLAALDIEGHLGTSTTDVTVTAVTGDLFIGDTTADDLQGNFDASAGGVNGSITIAGDILSGKTLNVGVMTGGDLTVGRDVAGDITATSLVGNLFMDRALSVNATVDVGTMTGNITVAFVFEGDIVATSLVGNITSSSGMGINGSITIDSAYDGTITNTTGAVRGTIHLKDDLDGDILLNAASGDLHGTIQIDGDITSGAQIVIADDIISPGRIWAKNAVAGVAGTPPIHITPSD